YITLTFINLGMPYWAAFVLAVAASFCIGVTIERILIRPMANAPILSAVGVFVGLLLIINSLSGWFFDYTIKQFPSPFPDQALFGGYISGHQLGSTGVTLAVLIAVYLFFRHTSLGLAMRAAALNPVSSRLVGVRVGWMLALGWGLAAAIGSIAGMMAAPIVYLDPNMMGGVLLYAFAGAVLGGIDNPFGAVFGGFAVGVLENLVGAYVVGDEVKLSVTLAVFAGALAFPFLASGYRLYQGAQVLIDVIALLGLNLLTGFNGQISLGHGAFFAIGGYGAAILTAKFGVPYWAAIPIASLVCFGAGFLFGFPALRFGGLYLALATFALAVATPQILSYKGFDAFTGGSQGLTLMRPQPPVGLSLTADQWLYLVCLASGAALYWVAR